MTKESLKIKMEDYLSQFALPTPLTFDSLINYLKEKRGTEILIRSLPDLDFGPICGLWKTVEKEKVDYIFVPTNATKYHIHAILRHEFSHMLLDHQAILFTTQEEKNQKYNLLGKNLIKNALMRSSFDDPKEFEAEYLADLLAVSMMKNPSILLRKNIHPLEDLFG